MATINCFTCFGDRDPVRDAASGALESKIGELISLLWDVTLGGITNLILLQRNAKRLALEMNRLEELRGDLMRRAMFEEAQPQMELMNQVKGWMERVQKLASEVTVFQESFERQSICITGICLGYSAVDKLRRVQELTSQGNSFSNVVSSSAPDANTLAREMDELRVFRDDIMRRVLVGEAANLQMQRKNAVKSWLERVDAFRCSSGSSVSVVNQLKQVRELKNQGDDLGTREVVSRVPPDAVEEVPSIPSSSIVGGEETLWEIGDCLRTDAIGIIGIYGMGGIGKTTLLKKIHNEFLHPGAQGMFNMVVWATVSKDMNILSIQKAIGERVGLSFSKDEGGNSPHVVSDQAKSLFKALCKKQFLIFMDDVWEKLDLEKIGIPHPNSRSNCKIAFTTRSFDVCIDMDADRKIRMKLLNEDQSWELFRKKMQADAILNDPSIKPLAKKVVPKCGGLPLALITVGRAMANKRTPNEWNHAIKALDDAAIKVRGMDEVLSALKFSYDGLENDSIRSCLLYCALFPEDYDIRREELIDYWIGEGLLDDVNYVDDDINDARDRGHVIISDLQAACLLENGLLDELRWVRMHDSVRDMALWLTSNEHGKANKFLVLAGKRLAQVPPIERWENAKRISLTDNRIKALPPQKPNCQILSTLFLNRMPLGPLIPEGFFNFMPMLRVLDIRTTRIEEVPVEIGSLVELRFLNMSWTDIRSLPKELGNLIRLRQLVLQGTRKLKRVPREAIVRLSSLQVLNLWESGYDWDQNLLDGEGGGCLLKVRDLEEMVWLQDLQIMLGTSCSLERVVMSDVLSSCTSSLCVGKKSIMHDDGDDGNVSNQLYGANGVLLSMAINRLGGQLRVLVLEDDVLHPFMGELRFRPGYLSGLEGLTLNGFGKLTGIVVGMEFDSRGSSSRVLPFQNLQRLGICGCHVFKHLTWVGQLPCLRVIELEGCEGIEELLLGEEAGFQGRGGTPDDDGDQNTFSKLKEIRLWELPAFRSISKHQLILPSLEELEVEGCPQLKRLPFGSHSARKIKNIFGEQEWWDGLEWDTYGSGDGGNSIVSTFLPHFRPDVQQ